MADIKDKLGEARYFLEQMRAIEGKDYPGTPLDADALAVDAVDAEEFMEAFLAEIGTQLRNGFQAAGEPFRYNLSAFLSAARTVVFMMLKKFSRSPGFKAWMEKAEGEEGMRRMTDMRDTTIHRRSVRPSIDVVDVNVTDDLRQIRVTWRWFFDEIPDKDVQAVCGEHIGKLERLVARCESQFGKKAEA
jgi:hypothetical protein